MDSKNTFQEFKTLVKNLVSERGWEKYHNPKDLAEAICIEAAELLEIFQWATLDEAFSWRNDSSKMKSIREELADVLIYCLSMANTLNIDLSDAILSLSDAILRKLKNEEKYPTEEYFRCAW